jgi:phenylacetate-CoA ligase
LSVVDHPPRRTPLEPWVLRRAGARDLAGLHRHQLAALRETVARARERSAFYAARLADLGPHEISTLAHISRLPFTTAEDIRQEGMRLLCVRPGEVERIVTLPTSGTTGDPKRIHFTAADQELTIDFFRHGMSVLAERGDRVLILLPGERPGSVGDLLRRGLARMHADGVVHGPVRDVGETLSVLAEGGYDIVVGIPVQVLGLARRSVAEGRKLRLRSVLLSTDHASAALVAAVERAWRCRVFDHYGTTEMGLGGGVECEAHAGYHLREADLLFEVVDPETGVSLPAGRYGEVVFTTLTREAMPLIRYRTGDRSRFIPVQCPCGSQLRLLERVRTRLADGSPQTPADRLDLAMLDEALFALPQVVDYRASLRTVDGQDVLTVEVLGAGAGEEPLRRAAAAALIPALRQVRPAGGDRLRLEVTVAATPWAGSDGTAKRTFAQSLSPEVRV